MTVKKNNLKTVKVPEGLETVFANAENIVSGYFSQLNFDPTKASIEINGERYVLLRASTFSMGVLHSIRKLYSDR
ncbi:MAG: hypothetical protein Fur0041_21360 [Bacteroidia bacterium]